nr:MAG TPA: hypothetical protein [Caudoviricetes sp.]DAO61737.1 MAG TPA: hypothetical protein [Bacteriophage sp.]DAW48106.1 MAG TPA: hypothetical protein [Caudoviricetes sp.]
MVVINEVLYVFVYYGHYLLYGGKYDKPKET